ncbi:MAG TPA: hypothetical protein VFC35_02290 [Gemmatimonadaceae bacterium]|nr:hypothetical protein [Gemmatimonadaceae bacterium]
MRDFIARQNSERLRQRLSGGWRVREPAAFTRLARSLVDMALVTGIIARLYRAMVLSRSTSANGFFIVTLTIGALFLLAMATIHLSRFPLRDWLWRAPAFAALEGVFEMLVSLLLISMHRESLGTGAAHFRDWPGMAMGTIGWRIVTISLFSLLLAGVVKWVRYLLLRKEHSAWSEGTVRAGIPGEEFIERRRR